MNTATGDWQNGKATTAPAPSSTNPADAPPPNTTEAYVSRAPEAKTDRAASRDWPEIPGYVILGELGRGGMGMVWKARQVGLDRLVALKMILAGAHANEQHRQRFFEEAKSVARLQHPHIVQVYEIGEHAGLPYFSLEYVEGGSLEKHAANKSQPPDQAAQVVETIARAIEYAHQNGIIHRDLKPANVLLAGVRGPVPGVMAEASDSLTPDHQLLTLKVADFGLAKQLEGDSGHTHTGAIMGTPSYMAPEQAAGANKERPLGPSVDIYALGAILYELLTGRPPFQGPSILDTLEQVRSREPVPPMQLQPGVPLDLDTICLKCLQKEPGRRYATAAELADDLGRYLRREPIRARPVGSFERYRRWCVRQPVIAALSHAVLGMCLLAIVFLAATLAQYQEKLHALEQVAAEAREKLHAQEQVAAEAKVAEGQADIALELLYNQVTRVFTELRDRSEATERLRNKLLADALAGLDRVAQRGENSALAKRTRAGVLQRKGDLYQIAGKMEDAQRQFDECHILVQQLVAAHPDDPLAQRAMGVILHKLAGMTWQKGNAAKAKALLEQSLGARQARLALEPAAADALAQMAIGEGALGRLAGRTQGDPATALRHYREALRWRDKAREQAPEDAIVQRERAALYDNLGETCQGLGDGRAARDYFEEARRVRTALFELDKEDAALQMEMANSYVHFGDVYFQMLKDPMFARAQYQEAVKLRRLALKPNPQNAAMQRALAMGLYRLATACLHSGDHTKADEYYLEALEIYERMASSATPDNSSIQLPYMLTLARRRRHQEAVEIAERLLKAQPRNPEFLVESACCYALAVAALPPGTKASDLTDHYQSRAFECLHLAVQNGWKDSDRLESDPDLAPIRDHPAFRAVLQALEQTSSPRKIDG